MMSVQAGDSIQSCATAQMKQLRNNCRITLRETARLDYFRRQLSPRELDMPNIANRSGENPGSWNPFRLKGHRLGFPGAG